MKIGRSGVRFSSSVRPPKTNLEREWGLGAGGFGQRSDQDFCDVVAAESSERCLSCSRIDENYFVPSQSFSSQFWPTVPILLIVFVPLNSMMMFCTERYVFGEVD